MIQINKTSKKRIVVFLLTFVVFTTIISTGQLAFNHFYKNSFAASLCDAPYGSGTYGSGTYNGNGACTFGTFLGPLSGTVGDAFPGFSLTGCLVPGGTTTATIGTAPNLVNGIIVNCIFVPNAGSLITTSMAGINSLALNASGVTSINISTQFNNVVVASTKINLQVLLSGDYNSANNNLNSTLNSLNKIPQAQPYNSAPFNYSGSETKSGVVTNIADWVLIELKPATGASIKKAVLIKNDGNLIDPVSNDNNIELGAGFATGSYNVIIRHRNHLAISTNTPITITNGATTSFSFVDNVNVKNGNQTMLATGKYGMRAGNVDGDGQILSTDRNIIQTSLEFSNVYNSKDVNMDGNVDSTDRTIVGLAPESNETIN